MFFISAHPYPHRPFVNYFNNLFRSDNKLRYLDEEFLVNVRNYIEFMCESVIEAFNLHNLHKEADEADIKITLEVFLRKFITDISNLSEEKDYNKITDKITMSNDITLIFDIDLSLKNEFYILINYMKPPETCEKFLSIISITCDNSMLKNTTCKFR